MADPRTLTGTEEFLPLSLLCLLHRSGGRLLRTRLSANKRRLLPSACSSYLKRRLPQGSSDQVGRWSPPQHWLARTDGIHVHQGPCLLPVLRARAPGVKDTTPQEGPACWQKWPWKMGDSSLHGSRVCLGHDLPPSSTPFAISRGDGGLKRFLLCWLSLRYGDRHGAAAAPCPGTQHPQPGEGGRAPHPGSFPPALLWPEWEDPPTKQGKAQRKCALPRKHAGQTLLAQKVLHMLRKQENAMGTPRGLQNRDDAPIAWNQMCLPVLVLVEWMRSVRFAKRAGRWGVFF